MDKQYVGYISLNELKEMVSVCKKENLSSMDIYLDRQQGFLVFGFNPRENEFSAIGATKVNKNIMRELEPEEE